MGNLVVGLASRLFQSGGVSCGVLAFGRYVRIIDQARKDGTPHGRPMTASKLVAQEQMLSPTSLSGGTMTAARAIVALELMWWTF